MSGEGAPPRDAPAQHDPLATQNAVKAMQPLGSQYAVTPVQPLRSAHALSSSAVVWPNAVGTEPVFREPWEAQAFAMTVLLHERGLFTWGEWAQALGAQIAGAVGAGAADAGSPAAGTSLADGASLVAGASPAAGESSTHAHAPRPREAAVTPAADHTSTLGIAASAREPTAEKSYYQHWLAALESLVAAKGASTADELTRYQRAWEHAAHRTPHGQSIDLQPQDLGG